MKGFVVIASLIFTVITSLQVCAKNVSIIVLESVRAKEQGGGWCYSGLDCYNRSSSRFGSSKFENDHFLFDGMLENNATFNPDFYNWNVVVVFYCDGSSFMSDIEELDPVYNMSYRGARIYDAVMEELLPRKGMINAKNTVVQVFGDWYFDRSNFQEMDTYNNLPRYCTDSYLGRLPDAEFAEKCYNALHRS